MSIEIYGSIVKEEQVQNVEMGILPNTLVIENQGQFPGIMVHAVLLKNCLMLFF
jgi:hypothetical protein